MTLLTSVKPTQTGTISVNGINLYYETFGNQDHPPVLLIMGLSATCWQWFPYFFEPIVNKNYYVIRFDNRDVGHSTWIDDNEWQKSPYTLEDMAVDAINLLKALSIEKAHLIGASMGGAIALQETGYLWRNIYKRETVARTLELCVGDTLSGSDGRTAFPKDKSALLAKPKGDEMFHTAREALEAIAEYNNDFKRASRNPERFCHGFGIFQYDLQFFLENPDFFLDKKWYDFDECLALCIDELKSKLIRTYGRDKTSLTDKEMVYVAIAYNRGSVDLSRDFKQGYFDGVKYYGEYIWDYLQLAKSHTGNRGQYQVNARSGLRVRSGPGTNFDVIDLLPFGHRVYVGRRQGDWVEVDLQGDGVIDGFVFASFLQSI